MFSYESLNEETKIFLNKAMDIYSSIENIEITKEIKDGYKTIEYTFSRLDKKVFSMFIASFISNTNLTNILKEYDDIKADDLFSFVNTEKENIKQLESNDYREYYDKKFRLDLISILNEEAGIYSFKELRPEIIFHYMRRTVAGSKIIEYFIKYFSDNINTVAYISTHPCFDAIRNYIKINGILQVKNTEDDFFSEFDEEKEEKKQNTFTVNKEELLSILDATKAKFIGQEEVTKYLFYNIINNQKITSDIDLNDGERSVIFLDGSSGTGKTAITREITNRLNIPLVTSSAVNYSSTGYRGDDIVNILIRLYRKAGNNLEKAERGIIVLDEFDKLAYNRENGYGLDMKKAVQQQLLDFTGGGIYEINVGENIMDQKKIEFDTSNLTFIFLGALTELRKNKMINGDTYTIEPDDLINIGLEKELVGRINTFLHTEEYSSYDLLRILKESTISPIKSFEKWIIAYGKTPIIADDVYEAIVNAAYKLNTGARSLQTIMNNVRTIYLEEVFTGEDNTVYLDASRINNAIEKTFVRKVRK